MRPILVSGEELAEDAAIEIAGGEICFYSAKSPDKVGPNEDSLCVIPVNSGSCVLAVADGVGGQRGGAEASKIAIEFLAKEIKKVPLRNSILDGIDKANDEILKLGLGAGTTLVAVQIHQNKMRSIHVGDSTALLVGLKGKCKYKSLAHSPIAYAVEAGFLDPKKAFRHEDSHILLHQLGAEDMRIEIGPFIELNPNDTLLLASDGLTDNLMEEKITEIIRKGSLQETKQELSDRAREQMLKEGIGKPDDLSFILFRPSEGK